MKRISTILLCGLLGLSLTGCASGGTSSATATAGTAAGTNDQTVLKVSGLDGGYGTDGWNAVAEAFTEETGIKVELDLEKNIAETLRPVLTSGKNVPDVI